MTDRRWPIVILPSRPRSQRNIATYNPQVSNVAPDPEVQKENQNYQDYLETFALILTVRDFQKKTAT